MIYDSFGVDTNNHGGMSNGNGFGDGHGDGSVYDIGGEIL